MVSIMANRANITNRKGTMAPKIMAVLLCEEEGEVNDGLGASHLHLLGSFTATKEPNLLSCTRAASSTNTRFIPNSISLQSKSSQT